jgi:predicted transcriptional regulator
MDKNERVLETVTKIVLVYLEKNILPPDGVPSLIDGIFKSVRNGFEATSPVETTSATAPAEAPSTPTPEQRVLKPAVPIEDSVRPDYIVCLEDGRKLKLMKRYLATQFNLTPRQYREKWGLSKDYPMTAPSYAERRAAFAKGMGLGKRRKAEAANGQAAPVVTAETALAAAPVLPAAKRSPRAKATPVAAKPVAKPVRRKAKKAKTASVETPAPKPITAETAPAAELVPPSANAAVKRSPRRKTAPIVAEPSEAKATRRRAKNVETAAVETPPASSDDLPAPAETFVPVYGAEGTAGTFAQRPVPRKRISRTKVATG